MANQFMSQGYSRGHQEAGEQLDYTSEGAMMDEDGNTAYDHSEESEVSEEPFEAISELAREEMSKLENIFHAKGLRFRMIGRIGEGKYVQTHNSLAGFDLYEDRNLFYCIQGRRLTLRLLSE